MYALSCVALKDKHHVELDSFSLRGEELNDYYLPPR